MRSVPDRLARVVRPVYHGARMARVELSKPASIPLIKRWRWYRQGFYSTRSATYDFDRWSRAAFVTDRQFYVGTGQINGPYRLLLHDKLAFHGLMATLAAPHPRLFAITHPAGLAFPRDGDAEALDEHLGSDGRVVIKPIRGGGGKGVRVWGSRPEAQMTTDRLQVEAATANDSVVVEFVEQARYSQEIFGGATNSIRMLTLWDERGGKPFLAAAVHRFGTSASQPTDNVSGGGLTAEVDIESGTLGTAARRPLASENRGDSRLDWVGEHPESGGAIEGVRIPGWSAIVDQLLDIAGRCPFLPYVGWDVVPTSNGFVILEGNSTPGVDLIQVHRPLLIDPRIREFYRRFNVVP